MARALELSLEKLDQEKKYIISLKNQFVTRLKSEMPEVKFNGDSDRLEDTTYTLVNVRLPLSAEKSPLLLFQLDLKGIACSKGSEAILARMSWQPFYPPKSCQNHPLDFHSVP